MSETTFRVEISSLRIRLIRSLGNKPASGNLDSIKDPLNDGLWRQLLCLRFVGERNAMSQHIESHRFHVLGRDEASVTQERVRLGGEIQVKRRAGAGPVLDKVCQILQPVLRRVAGGKHDV